jgi:hypothetical protein
MQPKHSIGNISNINIPPSSMPLRSALASSSTQQAYPFNYQAPLELHQRKRSIALIPNKFSVAAQQHEEFLRQWKEQERHKKLFSRAATLEDYEADGEEADYLDYPEVIL